MQVAIDVSPLQSGHKVRGTGFYLTHLLDALIHEFPEHTFHQFVRGEALPKDIDVIHYPYFEPFFLSLPPQFKHKTIVTVHDLTPLRFPKLFPVGWKGNLKWQIQKRRLKKASVVITDSVASQKDIQMIGGIPEERISVVYLAASPEFKKQKISKDQRDKLRKKYSLPETFVLYVGDVTPNKNLPILIQAIKKGSTPLVMVGKALASTDYDKTHPWNRDLASVQASIQGNPLFITPGFVPDEDLVMIYNLASALVFPSFYEGFGLPLVEAMQCGLPVITTAQSSMPEVTGKAAIVVDPSSPDQFAQAIKKILTNSKLAGEMSQKSILQAKKFSWEQTARETMKVYERVASL